ncbi:hypothetical protein [Flavisolibacter ginsengisoli]|jgi:hypothetical protein|uniref:Ion channel n=1 Tax=Flavisolibacter ginsengisoli DSM 18119 TaxID=1121884 RepID=A0A1M5FXK9_9BACT|nr:hypothetical protein [Flavisolibacter ginsengisoli]SHF96287.1 hypothetical protein SAMN02745131_03985 [Flavisolibacter ginsengisoli DSM 18119]
MYEHRSQKILPIHQFYQRVLKNLLVASVILGISLIIGVAGFCLSAGSTIIDAFHNSCMLLSGMGPVLNITNTTGKLFSSFYALFSGVVFITNIGVILAPVMHRIFHRLHLEDNDATSQSK